MSKYTTVSFLFSKTWR